MNARKKNSLDNSKLKTQEEILTTSLLCTQKLKILIYKRLGTSLAVQWLRLHLPMQGMWVQPLLGEIRSHMPRSQKTKT